MIVTNSSNQKKGKHILTYHIFHWNCITHNYQNKKKIAMKFEIYFTSNEYMKVYTFELHYKNLFHSICLFFRWTTKTCRLETSLAIYRTHYVKVLYLSLHISHKMLQSVKQYKHSVTLPYILDTLY